jgi:hypothetical protein
LKIGSRQTSGHCRLIHRHGKRLPKHGMTLRVSVHVMIFMEHRGSPSRCERFKLRGRLDCRSVTVLNSDSKNTRPRAFAMVCKYRNRSPRFSGIRTLHGSWRRQRATFGQLGMPGVRFGTTTPVGLPKRPGTTLQCAADRRSCHGLQVCRQLQMVPMGSRRVQKWKTLVIRSMIPAVACR